MYTLKQKIKFVFNKVSLGFIKELKQKDPSIKKKIKENYTVFDKSSDAHIEHFIEHSKFTDEFTKSNKTFNILECSTVKEFPIFKDILVADIVQVIEASEHEVISCYLYVLYMLSHLYGLDENEQTTELFNKSFKFIDTKDLDIATELDNIFDDDLKVMFENIYDTRKCIDSSLCAMKTEEPEPSASASAFDGFENAFDFLSNSKIGELAKEISQEIDVTNINVDKPEDLLDMDSLLSGKNQVLGDIIGKVSNRISTKIQSGEVKQEDLLKEAMEMMSKLNGTNSFMEDMMKSALNPQHHGPNLGNGKRRLKK